jgi:cephalosporin hydroxylase
MPLDLWVFQEIIYATKPDLIVEAGTYKGGSALYMATLLDAINHGQIVSIDIKDMNPPRHSRVTYLIGSSTAPEIVEQVKTMAVGKQRVMVVLDSDHSRDHVLNELKAYSPLVTKGNYLIVEDTNLNGHPVHPSIGPGPMEAVTDFLRYNDEYQIDKERERFYITFNPNGYLKKIK